MNVTATIVDERALVPVPPWQRVRRLTAGISLIASPLLLVAGFMVMPAPVSDSAAALRIIAAYSTRWYLFGLLELLSYVLLVPATLGLVHLAERRSPAWANLGGALTLLGAITAVADVRLWVFAQQQMAASTVDRPQMVGLIHRLDGAMSTSLPFVLGSLALLAGTVILAVGLYRARAVPGGICAVLIAGVIGNFAAWAAGNQPGLISTSLLLLIGYAWIGTGALRQPDRAWVSA
jgi:hypothetical protein